MNTQTSNAVAHVYLLRVPESQNFILSEKAKLLSQWAQKLLQYVAQKTWGEVEISRQNGKPVCNKGYVSVTHSGGYVAVALSDAPVGVDLQRFAGDSTGASRFFTLAEQAKLEKSKTPTDEYYFTWCKKEALWKSLDEQPPTVFSVDTTKAKFTTEKLALGGTTYYLVTTGEAQTEIVDAAEIEPPAEPAEEAPAAETNE